MKHVNRVQFIWFIKTICEQHKLLVFRSAVWQLLWAGDTVSKPFSDSIALDLIRIGQFTVSGRIKLFRIPDRLLKE